LQAAQIREELALLIPQTAHPAKAVGGRRHRARGGASRKAM
jgi:hypothetical protein